MNNLIRTDTIFGKRANIVGNISADLVLESLGKVYIKSRNKALTLEEIITSLALGDPNISTSRVKVLESINSVDVSSYKSGEFLYDKSSKILYLTLDGDVIELISVSPDGQNYVRRTGDTMSGKLIINVKGGPALQVNTADLIKNLNAEYLNGEKATEFTRRNKDERIKGAWTFEKPTSFESETTFYKDIRAYGSIGSPSFSSGYGGYGWRMDATTNTLTVDNLVVRKLMQVYELVVNKISATNGSLWVTNAGKITQVRKLDVYDLSFFNSTTDEYKEFLRTTHKGDYFVKLNTPIDFYDLGVDAFLDSLGTVNLIKNCLTPEVLYSARLVKIKTEGILELDFYNDDSEDYNIFLLFDLNFKFNTVFPIVTRNDYQSYKQAVENYDGTGTKPVANISYIYTYYKYFHSHVLDNLYLVSFDPEELPVFKIGDILRCQKWTYSGVKYYDAVVCNVLEMGYIIQVAPSVFDNNTSVVYNKPEEPTEVILEDSLNSTLYNSSKRHTTSGSERYSAKGIIGQVEEKDSLVLVGNLWNPQRLNAVYITSTDNGAPYIDTLSGMNRPDYSVIYYTPNFKKIKLYQTSGNTNAFIGYEGLVDVPYTGEYYVLKSNSKYDYIYFKYNNLHYLTTNVVLPSEALNSEVLYISCTPNQNTTIVSDEGSYLLTEDGFSFLTESGQNIVLELGEKYKLNIKSTKTTMARFGNLDGICDEIFPIDKQPYGYGLYGLNVFLTGEFYLNNGKSVADIGYDAIAFAVASEKNIYQSINVLKLDILIALNLLRQNFYNLKLNVYTKNELQTAGMYIGLDDSDRPGIVMWGNKILIATTLDELDGAVRPTALFEDGKIKAKYILVDEVHNTYDCDSIYKYDGMYPASNHFDRWNSVVDYYNYTSGEYDEYVTSDDSVVYYNEDSTSSTGSILYFREFINNENLTIKKWFQTNSYGLPIYDSSGSVLEITDSSIVDDPNKQQVKRWSLYKCGAGDLAGKIMWTSDGKMTITEATVGDFLFSRNGIYSRVQYTVVVLEDPIVRVLREASINITRDGYIELTSRTTSAIALTVNGGVDINAYGGKATSAQSQQNIDLSISGVTTIGHPNISADYKYNHGSINLSGPVKMTKIPIFTNSISTSNLDPDEVYSDKYGNLKIYNPGVTFEHSSETLLNLIFVPVSRAMSHGDDDWNGYKFFIRRSIPSSNLQIKDLFSKITVYWTPNIGVIEFSGVDPTLPIDNDSSAQQGVNILMDLFHSGLLDMKISSISEMALYQEDDNYYYNDLNAYQLSNPPRKLMCQVHTKFTFMDNIGLKTSTREITTFLTDEGLGTLLYRLFANNNDTSDAGLINYASTYGLTCKKLTLDSNGYYEETTADLSTTRVRNFVRYWIGESSEGDWSGFNFTMRII